ncbi:hypothetical protein FO519_002819 [Halicephalobus sp. NKZ332]|nr:hypothetical protein FO519_002819 [Halicephalobus sp. NKZ332]
MFKNGQITWLRLENFPINRTTNLNPAKMWYSEVEKANFNDLEGTMNCLHFTQLVWKKSTKIGIGVTVAKNGMCFVVADFDPPGNIVGYFSQNVSPPRS